MKLREIYEVLNREISGDAILADAVAYQKYPLKLSFSSYAAGIGWLADRYRKMGLQSEVLHFPGDGKTVYADRHFPLAWDVEEAWAEAGGERIADYEENSYSVVPFSGDSRGVCEAPLTAYEDLPEEGSLADTAVLISHMPDGNRILALRRRGCRVFFSSVDTEPIDPSLEDSRRWYNDLFGVGQLDTRDVTESGDTGCAGFSLTPRITRNLLARLKAGEKVTVRWCMRTRTYEGEAPAVTAVIPGEDDRAYFITAHGYEPHATNNVAGVAMSLGAAEALSRLIADGTLPKPKHSIRFFTGLENFSLYAWAMQNREKMASALGGTSVDSFGRYGAGGRTEHFVLRRSLNVHAGPQHAAAREALRLACEDRGIAFECREASKNNEDLMQDRDLGPAWNLLYGTLWEEPRETYPRCYFYHTSVDTADKLSPDMLSCAAVYAAAQAYYFAQGGEEEEQSALAEADWKRITDDKCLEAVRLLDDEPALRTLRAQRLAVWRDLAVASSAEAVGDPFRAKVLRDYILGKTGAVMGILCGGEPPKMSDGGRDREILRRTVPGPLGLGTVSDEVRAKATEAQGYFCREYWCVDDSGTMLYHYDGKKTVFAVAQAVWATRAYGVHEDPEEFPKELVHWRRLAAVLLEAGLAEKVDVPAVTKEDILEGLKALGVEAGDRLMVHSSLHCFGRVEGGADAVIDALKEAVTEDGILAMPAFTSCSDGGRGAFDPDETTIEPWVGIIPETFRKRGDTVRSKHPTHSVCASGKDAKEFLSQSEPYDCFAIDGPWARLLEPKGKILLIGPALGSMTFIHACEAWYAGYLDQTMAVVKIPDGEKQVRVTNYPGGCRGRWYKLAKNAPYFKKLEAKGVFRVVKVGNAELRLCEARDVAAAMRDLFAEDTFLLLHECGCADCARMRAKGKW